MATLVSVGLSLSPFLVFWAVAPFLPLPAVLAAGLVPAAAILAWRLRLKQATSLDLLSFALFLGLALAQFAPFDWRVPHAVAASLMAFGVFGIVSAIFGRPWTAEHARADYAGVSDGATFHAVNMAITVGWGLFAVAYAVAGVLPLGSLPVLAVALVGAPLCIFVPRAIMRARAGRALAAREAYRWPSPALGAAHRGDGYDVAVVGAGTGGLVAAALLAQAGARVVVAERADDPGGFCRHWYGEAERDGAVRRFRFDAGVHDVSGVRPGGPVASVLERLGVAAELRWAPVARADDVGRLSEIFPDSASGIAALFDDFRAIHVAVHAAAPENGGIPVGPRTVDEHLAFPARYPVAHRWLARPLHELVAAHVADPAAQAAVLGWPFHVPEPGRLTVGEAVPLFGRALDRGAYPVGGSGRIADVLASALARNGGRVLTNTPVSRICVEHGRATGLALGDGRRLQARAVVSGADLKHTFLTLVGPANLPEEFRRSVEETVPGASAFAVQLGLDIVPDLPCVTALRTAAGETLTVVATSALDPSAAPAGCCALQILTLVPHGEARRWMFAPPGEERERRKAFADGLIDEVATLVPQLGRHIVYRGETSPAAYARLGGSSDGTISGIERPGRLGESKTPLPGLVVAGSAGGIGIEGAFVSGALAADGLVPGLLARAPAARPR